LRVQSGGGEDLVISNGVEAWALKPAGWGAVDTTTAFLKSDRLTPAQVAEPSATSGSASRRRRSRIVT